jgi:3'-phosphoadenosine 5'-phosphosulfate sulfotransferase (PAPS reductase)/FAD synthetase
MVMAHLFQTLGQEANLVFAATGFDCPEDLEFIGTLQAKLSGWDKVHLHVHFGNETQAWQALERCGPITLTNPWCRRILKYPNRDAVITRLYPNQAFIAFEGSRWYENDFRRSHPQVMLLDIPGYSRAHYWALPLAPWNGLDIWSYILQHNLAINPLYFEGFQRTTCWICPLVNPYHLHRSRELYPELWRKVAAASHAAFPEGDARWHPF